METQWILANQVSAKQVLAFAEQLKVPDVIARVLLNRGIDSFEKARSFFRPELTYLYDPFVMKDMDRAVERLASAVQKKERIVIYGDYDVDGTTSVALLYRFLEKLGCAPRYYIPNRLSQGYGLSEDGIREVHRWGTDLIITTDCGITAVQEVALARELGMDVIVSDHHEPGESIPEAHAVLNPKRPDCPYPFKELAGVGVAFKLVQGLSQKLQLEPEWYLQYLDLVAVGSAADIVPLIDENRVLVNAGLQRLQQTQNFGLLALMESSGLKGKTLNTGQIVFTLAPRINAVGRMGNASRAVHLLIAESFNQAANIASILETENRNRRRIDEDTFNQALELVKYQYDPETQNVIVLAREDWHPGVIGIVASRLVEKFYRPAVMISLENGAGKGSARSIPGFDIYQALKSCSQYIVGFGGHKYAAGLSIMSENVELLRKGINDYARQIMDESMLTPKIYVDSELRFRDLSPRFIRILNLFAPYGPQNMRPVFMSRNLQVIGSPQIVGNNHLKFKVKQDGIVIDAIGFNLGDLMYRIEPQRKNLDMVYGIEENEYLGRRTLQLKVKDLR